MSVNKFKLLLCCYTMGITGCNKIGNPSYMDGGGDRKDDKKQEEKASFSVEQSSSTVVVLEGSSKGYKEMLEDSLTAMKRLANTAEQIAISSEESVNITIKYAADAKIAAEMARKNADDAEKNKPELGGGDTLYNKEFQDSLTAMKRFANTAEQVAISMQEAVDIAIKDAADTKIAAEMARKNADDAEKNKPELGGGDKCQS